MRHGIGINSNGQETPERKSRPTEKKAMSNKGASLSLKKREHDNPKNAVANRSGSLSWTSIHGLAK